MSDDYNVKLAPYCDKRIQVTATFERFGRQYDLHGRSVETALIRHVALESTGDILAEHTWLPTARGFRDLALRGGDRIGFEATVGKYQKRVEQEGPTKLVPAYGLRNPSDIRLLSRLTRTPDDERAEDDRQPCEEPAPAESEATRPREPEGAPATASSAAGSDPVAVIATVKQAAQFVGGWDRLRQLVDLLAG